MGLREYFAASEISEKYVYVSDRFKGKFLIRGISEAEVRARRTYSETEFIYAIISCGCIEPEIDREMAELLLPGEAVFLYNEIIKAGGLDESFFSLKSQVRLMLKKGDADTVYSCLAAFEMGLVPSEYMRLGIRERACIGAFLDEKINTGRRRRR